MAEIKVSLRAVLGDVHLAVLERRHRPGIDIEIWVELPEAHAIAASLQKRTECGRRKTFPQGRDHAAGDKDQPRHGRPTWLNSYSRSRGRAQQNALTNLARERSCAESPQPFQNHRLDGTKPGGAPAFSV